MNTHLLFKHENTEYILICETGTILARQVVDPKKSLITYAYNLTTGNNTTIDGEFGGKDVNDQLEKLWNLWIKRVL